MIPLKYKKITAVWVLTVVVLFIACVVMGILMRMVQGETMKMGIPGFYATMTVHGISMIGIWFVAGMAGVNYLLLRYVKVPLWSNLLALVLTVLSVVMIWCSAFVGNFHAGWTFLYPLPLFPGWEAWATPAFLIGIALLGVGWLLWSGAMLTAIFSKYSLKRAFGWQHLQKSNEQETPAFVMITVVTLVGIITSLLTAFLLVILYFLEMFSGGAIVNDALLMKNLTYFFGHTVANEILYLGLATLYEILPDVTGRPRWKNTWYVTLAWNATMVFILFAFLHHLYMDFVQPVGMQIIGQIASYFASLPAVAVTLFSVLVLIFRNPIRWSTTSTLYFLGIMGWVIGGVGAVIDATISYNFVLHNTLWVPAHFHTYTAMGSVLISLAFFNWITYDFFDKTEPEKTSRLHITLLLIGGFGFLLMFYLGGAHSIPRRFNQYPAQLSIGADLAFYAAIFATIYLIAILMINYNIVKRCLRIFYSQPSQVSSA